MIITKEYPSIGFKATSYRSNHIRNVDTFHVHIDSYLEISKSFSKNLGGINI